LHRLRTQSMTQVTIRLIIMSGGTALEIPGTGGGGGIIGITDTIISTLTALAIILVSILYTMLVGILGTIQYLIRRINLDTILCLIWGATRAAIHWVVGGTSDIVL
jgi:hypothetical protein